MSYDYQTTSVSLYRALFKDNYSVDVSSYLKPDEALAKAIEIAPILHPTFEVTAGGSGRSRPPDIAPNKHTGQYEPDQGGTSVFGRPWVLKRADGDFLIPEGTDIPPGLKISKDKYNDRLKATHYTIMPATPMFKVVLTGKLDHLVRNAIRRQCEKAREGQPWN